MNSPLAGTPLDLPPAMSAREAKSFIASLPVKGDLVLRQMEVAAMDRDTELPLVRHLLDNNLLDARALRLAIKYGNTPHTYTPNPFNTLLIAQRLNDLLGGSDYSVFILNIMHAVNGLALSAGTRRIGRITTKEELDQHAAVVRFCTLYQHDDLLTRYKRGYVEDAQYETTTVLNCHLNDLLMERPESYDAIDAYIKERGMHSRNKRPVQALREYLDKVQEAPAISSGWL